MEAPQYDTELLLIQLTSAAISTPNPPPDRPRMTKLLSQLAMHLAGGVSVARKFRRCFERELCERISTELAQSNADDIETRTRNSLAWLETLRWTQTSTMDERHLAATSLVTNGIRRARWWFARKVESGRQAESDFFAETALLLRSTRWATVPFVVGQGGSFFVIDAIVVDLSENATASIFVRDNLCRGTKLVGRDIWTSGIPVASSWYLDIYVPVSDALLLVVADVPSGLIGCERISERSFELAFALAAKLACEGNGTSLDLAAGGLFDGSGKAHPIELEVLRSKARAAAYEGYDLLYAGNLVESADKLKSSDGLEIVENWKGALAAIRRRENTPNRPAAIPSISTSPWVGLLPYSEHEQEIFFGRNKESSAIASMLMDGGIAVIFGPSGSGKSSLVYAGIIPQVRWRCKEVAQQVEVVRIIPGPHPPLSVQHALSTIPVGAADVQVRWCRCVESELRATGDPLVDDRALVRLLSGLSDRHTVLVIDQLEEVFTVCCQASERTLFLKWLNTLAGEIRSTRLQSTSISLIIVIRGDRLADLLGQSTILENCRDALVGVVSLRGDQLLPVINGPAEMAGVKIDSGLAERIVDDAASEPGALALVSHLLATLWNEVGDEKQLTHERYNELGRLETTVMRLAENAYTRACSTDGSLNNANVEKTLRIILSSLGLRDADGSFSRQRVPVETIVRSFGIPTEQVERILAPLVQSRLITYGHVYSAYDDSSIPTASNEQTIEVAHEIVLRKWPRLLTLLREHAEIGLLRQDIIRACEDWTDSRKKRGLWTDDNWRLGRAEELLDGGELLLSAIECDYIRSSRHAADNRRRLRAGIVATILMLTAAVIVLWSRAESAARKAEQLAVSERAATADALAREATALWSQPRRRFEAIRQVLEAANKSSSPPTSRVRGALAELAFRSIEEPPLTVLIGYPTNTAAASAIFSPGGDTIAAHGADVSMTAGLGDYSTRVWNTHTGEPVARIIGSHHSPATDLNYSSDGTSLVALGEDLIVWDTRKRQSVELASGVLNKYFLLSPESQSHTPRPSTVLSGDASTLAVLGNDNIEIWNISSRSIRTTIGSTTNGHSINPLLSSDGKWLVTNNGADRIFTVWDTQTGHQQCTIENSFGLQSRTIFRMTFTEIPGVLVGYEPSFGGLISFDCHDCHIIARGSAPPSIEAIQSDENRVLIWSQVQPQHWDSWNPFTNQLTDIVPQFGHDASISTPRGVVSRYVLAHFQREGGGAFLRDFGGLRRVRLLGNVQCASFSHDGLEAVTCDDAALLHWHLHPALRRVDIRSIKFLPDSSKAVVVTTDSVLLLNLSPLQLVDHIGYRKCRSSCGQLLSISSDGKIAALAERATPLQIFDIGARSVTAVLPVVSPSCIGLTPNGDSLVAFNSNIEVWDIRSKAMRLRRQVEGDMHPICSISPSGSRFAVSHNNDVIVGNSNDGSIITRLVGHRGGIVSIDFSQDGTNLVVVDGEGAVKQWVLTEGSAEQHPLVTLVRIVSASFGGKDQRIIATGGPESQGMVQIWDAHTRSKLFEFATHLAPGGAVLSNDMKSFVVLEDDAAFPGLRGGDVGPGFIFPADMQSHVYWLCALLKRDSANHQNLPVCNF